MNNKGAQSGGLHIGGASILMIFVLLCLTTFAALTMVSASASFRLAERVVIASDNYFAADSLAEEVLAEISAMVRGEREGYGMTVANRRGDAMSSIIGRLREMGVYVPSMFLNDRGDSGSIIYIVPIDEVRVLIVGAEFHDGSLRVTSWRVEANYAGAAFDGVQFDVWRGEP